MMSLNNAAEIGSKACLPACASAVLYLVVAMFFHPQGLDQFIIPKIMVLVVGAPVLLGLVAGWRPVAPRDPWLVGVTVLFLGWSVLLPFFSARNRVLHGYGALEVVVTGLAFLGALCARQGGAVAEQRIIRLLAIPTLAIASLAVMQGLGVDPFRLIFGFSSGRPGRWQVLTTQGNPSWSAEVIVLGLPFVLLACSSLGRWRRTGAIVAGLMLVSAVMATGSRGAMLGLGVVAVGGPALGLVSLSRRTRWVLGMAVVLLGIVFLCGNRERLLELKPLTGRLGLWAAGVHLASEQPISGLGLRHVYLVLPDGLEKVVAATAPGKHALLPTLVVDRLDNDLLHVVVERGWPAALLLLLVWGRAVRNLIGRKGETRSPLEGASAICLIVFGVLSLFSAPLHTPSTAVLFWFVVGVAAGGSRSDSIQFSRIGRWVGAIAGLLLALIAALLVAVPVMTDNASAGRAHRLRMRSRNEEVARILGPLTERAPWLPGAAIDRAGALVDLGRAPDALVVIDKAEQWAQSEWFWALRVRALDQLGRRDEARRALDRGFAVLPRSPVLLGLREELAPE